MLGDVVAPEAQLIGGGEHLQPLLISIGEHQGIPVDPVENSELHPSRLSAGTSRKRGH